jgi:chromate transport protein ChrA
MRRGALLKDAQLSGMLPMSVAGGEKAPGNWSLMAGFCGPGSKMLLGFLALIAPCGGSFGLPKVISLFTGVAASAVVIVAAVTSPPAAVAASMSRLENIVLHSSCKEKFEQS